jgi:ubiquinone/menaquinone biosynthesis C-methylase UbiE
MPDVWSTVAELDPAVQDRMAAVLETRGADPQQRAMRRTFLTDIDFSDAARVLEVGCGTGVLTRVLAEWPGVGEVIGIDPAASLIDKARDLAGGLSNVTFQVADGRDLAFDNSSFDVVIFDSTLCHVPEPERALAEAFRVLRPAGWLAAFDGDYATTTVALSDHDPLQACADVMMANSVNDRWLVRRLPAMVRGCGCEVVGIRSYGFTETTEGGYMLTVVERGADMLHALGRVGSETAAMLKAEAHRRIEEGSFYGHVAYGSVVARKPEPEKTGIGNRV